MNIDFDLSFVFQMVLFSALIVILKPLLFTPVLRVFEEREKVTEGARAEARRMQEEAGELLRRYEHELSRVNEVARQEREQARTQTARLEADMMNKARDTANAIVDEGRRRTDAERSRIEFELGRESERLARVMAEAVLGRSLH
ncbi:MAG: ATP synthase F0 subunit B [Polyangiaceae bacterium]